MIKKYPCPCCGYLVFSEPPGSYEICPICRWEDDVAQLRNPYMNAGANKISLIEAQKNFHAMGAKDTEYVDRVRKPHESDMRDGDWRMIDPNKDLEILLQDSNKTLKVDSENPYYWKKSRV